MADAKNTVYQSLADANPQGVGDFLHSVYQALKKAAQQGIDTAAERGAITEGVLKFYDERIAAHLPSPMVKPFRESLSGIVTSTLETLAAI